jgi:hypothetical protein
MRSGRTLDRAYTLHADEKISVLHVEAPPHHLCRSKPSSIISVPPLPALPGEPAGVLQVAQHVASKRVDVGAHRALGSLDVAVADRLENPVVLIVDAALMIRRG